MNIGYFTTGYPYKNPYTGEITNNCMMGGVQLGTYNLALKMSKLGHSVYVFTTSVDNKESYENYGNIHIYRYPSSFYVGQCPISISLLWKPVFSKIDLDIIHARMGNLPAPLTAYLYAKKRSKKLIVSYHGDWVGGFGGLKRRVGVFLFNKVICNKILNASEKIIALSKEHLSESKYLNTFSDKIVYIPNGVNLEDFDTAFSKEESRIELGLPVNSRIILFVGSLIWRKAPDVLLKSMLSVISKIPNAYLIFVGDGNSKQELFKMANQLGILKSVLFAGYVSDSYIKNLYYNAADVFVLPSRNGEAYPNVLLEASACSLPMVVSECECFKAIVKNGDNGLISKTGNELDLANKLIYILQNETLREKMGANAKEAIAHLSWENIAYKTESLYFKL